MKLINNKKEKKRVKSITLVIRKLFTNYDVINDNSYINLSINNKVEVAAITLAVRDSLHERDLHRFLGANPSRGASTLSNNLSFTEIKT